EQVDGFAQLCECSSASGVVAADASERGGQHVAGRPGELVCPAGGGLDGVVVESVDEPGEVSFGGVDRAAGQDEVEGDLLADELRESLGGAGTGAEAHGDLGHAEGRARGGDAEGAGDGELEAAAPGRAVDHGDGGERGVS